VFSYDPAKTGRENRIIVFCPVCDWQSNEKIILAPVVLEAPAAGRCCAGLHYVRYEAGVEDDAAVEHVNIVRAAHQKMLRRRRIAA